MGLFNLGKEAAQVTAYFSDLKLTGARADKGKVKDKFEAIVPSHGVVLVKIAK